MVAVRQVTLATTWNVAGPKWEVPECKILSIQRLGTKKRNRKYLIDNLQVLSIGWNDNISDILDKVRYIAEINFTCFFFFFPTWLHVKFSLHFCWTVLLWDIWLDTSRFAVILLQNFLGWSPLFISFYWILELFCQVKNIPCECDWH